MISNKQEKHYPLALIVPTHYSEPLNYASICQSLHAAQVYSEQIQLVISDNSQDQEKFDFLKKISSGMNNVKLIHGPLEKNHLCALNAANCDYVLFAHDDDMVIHPALGDIIDLLLAHPQSIGLQDLMVVKPAMVVSSTFFLVLIALLLIIELILCFPVFQKETRYFFLF